MHDCERPRLDVDEPQRDDVVGSVDLSTTAAGSALTAYLGAPRSPRWSPTRRDVDRGTRAQERKIDQFQAAELRIHSDYDRR